MGDYVLILAPPPARQTAAPAPEWLAKARSPVSLQRVD